MWIITDEVIEAVNVGEINLPPFRDEHLFRVLLYKIKA